MDLGTDYGGGERTHSRSNRKKRRKYRKKRYTSIDTEGNLRLLHAKGEKCKGCIHKSVPVGEPPCLKCLAESDFLNYNGADGSKFNDYRKYVYTCRHPYRSAKGKRGCAGGYIKKRKK